MIHWWGRMNSSLAGQRADTMQEVLDLSSHLQIPVLQSSQSLSFDSDKRQHIVEVEG